MAYFPYATEIDSVYTLTTPSLGSATFNSPLAADYAGMLSEVTGLDSPEVRESAEELAQADGGSHGYFWFGRRPITLTARFFGHTSLMERTMRMDRARRASLALRADAVLAWTPSPQNGVTIPMFTYVRRAGAIRESGAWVKDMQIPLVSEYAAIYSLDLRTAVGAGPTTSVSGENKGSWPAQPIIRITGPTQTSFSITGGGGSISLVAGTLLVGGEILEIDTLNHTATFVAGPRVAGGTGNANSFVNYTSTLWPSMPTGNTTFTLSGTGTIEIRWRDTWM
jgi:hypothetical protein